MNQSSTPQPRLNASIAIRVVGLYLLMGCLWILFSDQLLDHLTGPSNHKLTQLQTLKGWFYVLTTAGMLYWLIDRETRISRIATLRLKNALRKLQTTQAALQELNTQLEQRVIERTAELQTLSDRLMEAQSIAHIGSWEYDHHANTIFWSDEIFRIFGLDPEQEEPDYATHLAQHYPPEDGQHLHACVLRALEQSEPYEVDVQICRADRSLGWILAKGQPIVNEQQQVVRLVGIALDITERKAIEVQQQQLSQMKDDFLNTVSHELRSPLASIKMAVELLEINLNRILDEPNFGAQPQRLHQYLGILREQCNQELELVNNLLDLQRLEAERIQLEITPIEVREWVSKIAQAFEGRMQERQQQLQMLLPPALSPFRSDVEILSSILRELLTNACKYTPPGETITVEVCSTPEALQIKVNNRGVTIVQEELERIFDKFYRIPKSDQWKQGGTGLGLALIKKQVNYLGGTIWAESDAEGVNFIVSLPLDRTSGD